MKAEEMAPPEPAKVTPEQMAAATEHPKGPHHPPMTGKMVGDHWTPYTPPDPESYPLGSQVYIIVAGDTLWDLAGKFLTNAWLWPQLWDVNQYITDSHWIYPGDPILVPGAPTVISEAPPPAAPEPVPAPTPVVEEEPEEVAEAPPPPPPLPRPPALVPVALDSEIYCSNFITQAFEPPALFIEEKEEGGKTLLTVGDVVFLSQGAQSGVEAGQIYSVVTPEHDVWHPVRAKELIGTSVRSIGRIKVLAVQGESATAEIIEACDDMGVGDYLMPFEEVPVPLSTPVAFQEYGVELKGENDGYIVHVMDNKLSFGQGDIVNIDMGTDSGVQPGDVFTIFREWGGEVEFASAQSYIEGQQQRAEKLAKEGEAVRYSQAILGQLVVIGAREKTATAKVLVAVREMCVGDRVELR